MHALCFLSESFRLSFNHIARYALSRNTKIFSIKIHKSFAKQFIEIPLIFSGRHYEFRSSRLPTFLSSLQDLNLSWIKCVRRAKSKSHKFHWCSRILSVLIRANSWDIISSPTNSTDVHWFLNFQVFSFSDSQILLHPLPFLNCQLFIVNC